MRGEVVGRGFEGRGSRVEGSRVEGSGSDESSGPGSFCRPRLPSSKHGLMLAASRRPAARKAAHMARGSGTLSRFQWKTYRLPSIEVYPDESWKELQGTYQVRSGGR